MTEKKFRAKSLECGCCGSYFHTWPEYVDQDQDAGYGICYECQEWQQSIANKQLDDLAMQIENALSPERAEKFRGFEPEKRRWFAMKAIEDGMVTYSIGGRQ